MKAIYRLTWLTINITSSPIYLFIYLRYQSAIVTVNFTGAPTFGDCLQPERCASRAAGPGCFYLTRSRSLEQPAEATGEKRLARLSLWIPAQRGDEHAAPTVTE